MKKFNFRNTMDLLATILVNITFLICCFVVDDIPLYGLIVAIFILMYYNITTVVQFIRYNGSHELMMKNKLWKIVEKVYYVLFFLVLLYWIFFGG